MSKLPKREWYRRVNETWPETVPELTEIEAVRAAKKLYRFATRRTFFGKIDVASGNRRNYGNAFEMRINPSRGWKNMVHELSHELYFGPHGGEHARGERRMIREVLTRSWLNGALKDKPKPEKPAVPPRERKYQSIVKRLESWQRKQRRAENACKKLARQMKRMERAK